MKMNKAVNDVFENKWEQISHSIQCVVESI